MAISKTTRFGGLKDLADGREAQAARGLAQSLHALRTKEAQLRELRDYLDEYRREEQDAALDAARWENSRRFLSRLNDAVTLRESELDAARARYEEEADRWRRSHRHTKALEQLVEKYYREELRNVERRDQKELDELVARRKE